MTPTDRAPSVLLDGDKDQPIKGWVEDNVVGTRAGVDDQGVGCGVRVGDPHERGQAADLDGIADRVDRDRVTAVRAANRDRVGLTITARATGRGRKVDL